jgi:3-oxoacyl-[acyl-carrier protein] reductase
MDSSTIPALDFSRLGPPEGTRMAVVGGCGGIGRALVSAGLKIGLRIAVLDLPSSLKNYPPPSESLAHPIDATDEASVNDAFKAIDGSWGGLDIMVNLVDMSLATWDEVTTGNLRSTFLCAKAALPLLARGSKGAIVNTASGLAYKGLPGTAPYGAAKAGVIALSKSLANENAPNIRVNVIAPGAVDTAFLRGGTSRTGDDMTHDTHIDTQRYADATPLGRLAVVDDVVAPILFLCGDASRFITGQVIHINGGGYMP